MSSAESEDGEGPYTCKSCCRGTWNDSDHCDDCANVCACCGVAQASEDSRYCDEC